MIPIEKESQKQISTAITKLVVPYLDEYDSQIDGVLLSPYKIGANQKIEIIIVKKQASDINLLLEEKQIENLTIHTIISEAYKITRDFKTSYPVYDPKGTLSKIKYRIEKDPEVKPFYNSEELPTEIITCVRQNIKVKRYQK
ncbi:MAG: hypothetical protein PUB18_02920 [bacterium]|nr:hypothetical protein [bacterium]